MQWPPTPTTRATLLTLPMHACTMPESLFPPWALAIAGIANRASTKATI